MVKVIFILFSILTLLSGYMTYQGVGLQEVKSIEKKKPSVRSSSHSGSWGGGSSYSGGFSSGK
jgi:hypothetical protein